jgi:phenylacetate-CoA ligase
VTSTAQPLPGALRRGARERAASALWHAHPARPGREYAALRRSQWWPRERLEALQVEQLRRLVAAATRVPFYRERFAGAGVDARAVRALGDLRRLPVLERADLERLGVAGLRTPGSRGMRASSSGSLGAPVQILWPLSQMRWLDAGEARARSWFGSEVGARRLEVRCRPVGRLQALSATLLNLQALHARSVADRRVLDRLVASLERRPPTLVWGVSNALYTVARALLADGRAFPVRACWSGGNHLHPHYRAALEQAFRCEVYERYATIETGVIAHECPEGRSLHVPAEGVIVEIVRADGSWAAPGEPGDVVVTSLRNHATPLLRYRVGDRAVAPASADCSCGRGLPVFGRVEGRSGDFLRTASDDRVGRRAVLAPLDPLPDGIVDLQVRQDAGRRLTVLVESDAPLGEQRERIGTTLSALAEPPEPPHVERVDRIELTPGGKVRTVISDAWGA